VNFEVMTARGLKGVTVSESEVRAAQRLAFAKLRLVIEPGGSGAGGRAGGKGAGRRAHRRAAVGRKRRSRIFPAGDRLIRLNRIFCHNTATSEA
jgi:hypothetical protein